MKQARSLGCLGIVIFIGTVLAIGAIFKPTASTTNAKPETLPGRYAIVSQGGWQVIVTDFELYERFYARGSLPVSPQPQGRLVVAGFDIKNLQQSTSNFTTSDFKLRASDGREFSPSGQTATIERGFMISQTVQPGLTTRNRVVFDVDPSLRTFVLTALRMSFAVTIP